jgi:hypothetical protein
MAERMNKIGVVQSGARADSRVMREKRRMKANHLPMPRSRKLCTSSTETMMKLQGEGLRPRLR